MSFKTKILLAAMLVGLFVCCVNTFGQTAALAGKWNLSALKESGKTVSIKTGKTDAYQLGIEFLPGNNFVFHSSCNSVGGRFTAETSGKFRIRNSRTTIMSCGEAANDLERILGRALKAATLFEIRKDVLILRDADETNVMTFKTAEKSK